MMNCIWARNTDVETLDPVAGEVIQGREKNVALSVGEPGSQELITPYGLFRGFASAIERPFEFEVLLCFDF